MFGGQRTRVHRRAYSARARRKRMKAFCVAEEEMPARHESVDHTLTHALLVSSVEVNEDVATEDDVERSARDGVVVVDEVQSLERHHRTQLRASLDTFGL